MKGIDQPILIPDENVSIENFPAETDLYPIVQASPIIINAYTEILHRKIFISRVYTILWLQLLFTSSFGILFLLK